MSKLTPEAQAAALFHDTYEKLAPSFGYETRKDTRKFDPNSPNGKLMIAVCGEVLAHSPTLKPCSCGLETRLRDEINNLRLEINCGHESDIQCHFYADKICKRHELAAKQTEIDAAHKEVESVSVALTISGIKQLLADSKELAAARTEISAQHKRADHNFERFGEKVVECDMLRAELVAARAENYNLATLLGAHRRYHAKVGCPGEECSVCKLEEA